ncbi:MAG: DNA polymerase III subunit gamma/tau [Candidatus Pacebacteria bacterium]|jgi:DNA polymerase-3 subunit gamma/tau|nr:DNA polymerase III, subunit gamma and tau [bacterium]MDP6527849.1 DNA polymerase III subunit gamma/tau [Candidatus Paceibacterota bacterium]MDP6659796.1 DNA polymerase III subunit gamma/tau [Candidatus Paceibacterota bacterium]|tara:strand:+ start:11941 stop:12960 length:1020 start_codon:yes stop_codon:yes gene_type:complete
MSEVVLYRKYRPEKFKDVRGQEHVVSVLEAAIKGGNIGHAYLFSGSRGTGKTTVARILAREIGCDEKDLYEMDAASNRGIDDIRELRDAVATLPFSSEYKVYIIDEVHMLTKEAFNALLKTLEEPPKHAVFVLATTEIEKLPETIVSRCEAHTFRKPSQEMLRDMIIDVAKSEGFTLDEPSADLVAILSEGSYRDAHGILQKVLTVSKGKKISAEDIEKVTGAPKGTLVNDFLSSLSNKDKKTVISKVDEVVKNNLDVKTFVTLVLHKLRAALLMRHAPEQKESFKEQFSKEDLKFLEELSKEEGITLDVLEKILRVYDEVPRSYIPQLPLEVALMELL